MSDARLAGQVALVTGAGRGIGRAIAETFAAQGAAVALAARSSRELANVANAIQAGGGRALAVPTDVRQEPAVAACVKRTVTDLGRLDVLVAAAGVAVFGPVTESRPADWDEMMAVNLRGAYLSCRAALPTMLAQRRGTLLLVGSMVTGRTLPGSAGYTAAKYGLLGLGRVLTEELRGSGVRVGVLSAGAVDTPLWDSIPGAPDRSLMITPAQVAEVALLMATLAPNASLEELTLMPARGVL
jgi:NADP-dependent 3-hydroxy acid dehydrogenase YdfG